MGAEVSSTRVGCCGRPLGDPHGSLPEEVVEDSEYLEPPDVERLIKENRSELEKALEQIGKKRSEVQESSRRLELQRRDAEEAAQKLQAEREEIAAEWCRIEASRGELRAEREAAQRLHEELQAGQESLQVEQQEVSRLRAEIQASQKNSWWFSCANAGGEKKYMEAKGLPLEGAAGNPLASGAFSSQDCNPRKLSFETHLPSGVARAVGGA